MREISRADLWNRLDRSTDLKLVFVLSEWQYRSARIPGSLHMPYTPSVFGSEDAFSAFGPDDDIVVYCSNEACFASIGAYYLLEQRGFKNVQRYAGGLLDWQEAGYTLAGEMAQGRDCSGPGEVKRTETSAA
jgi:rhodanese-related sulfurtransferase